MNELHAEIGRLHMENAQLKAILESDVAFLARVVTGEIAVSRILVNLTDKTYTWSEPDTRPAMPAQLNGLPICVVAPDEPPDDRNDSDLTIPPRGDEYSPLPNGDGHNRIKELLKEPHAG